MTLTYDSPKNGVLSHYFSEYLWGIRLNDGSFTIVNLDEIINCLLQLIIGQPVIVKKLLTDSNINCGGGSVIEFQGKNWLPGITYFFLDSNKKEHHYLVVK